MVWGVTDTVGPFFPSGCCQMPQQSTCGQLLVYLQGRVDELVVLCLLFPAFIILIPLHIYLSFFFPILSHSQFLCVFFLFFIPFPPQGDLRFW